MRNSEGEARSVGLLVHKYTFNHQKAQTQTIRPNFTPHHSGSDYMQGTVEGGQLGVRPYKVWEDAYIREWPGMTASELLWDRDD